MMKHKRFFLMSIVLLIRVSEGSGRKCKVPQGHRCSRLQMPEPKLPYPPPEPQPPAPPAPEPQLPEHVTPVPLLPCQQRKKQCGMFPQKCRTLAKPRFGYMRCWKSPSVKKCTAKCFGYRVFRGTQVKRMTLICRSFNFEPRNKFPDCVGQKNWKLTRPKPQAPQPQAPQPPEPQLPEHVTPIPLLPRRQRKKQCGMFPQQCPTLAFPRFAHIRCRTSPSMKKCTAECTGHHVFRGTQLKKMTLTCTSFNFKPRRKFPDCVRNGKCRLKLVGTGKIKCRSHFNSIECEIICGSRNKCSYTCDKDGNWSPSLPRCVKPLGLQKVRRRGPQTKAPKPKTPKPKTRKPKTRKPKIPKSKTQKPKTPRSKIQKPQTAKPKTPKLPKPVTQVPLLPRQQRKKQCPTLKPPRFAAMGCWKSPIEKKCIAKCIEHHVFRGTRLKEMTLICRSNTFQPRNKFPDCVRSQQQVRKPKTPKPKSRKPKTRKPKTSKPPKSQLRKPFTQVPLLPCQQRKKQCWMFQQQCPKLTQPRFAALRCRKSPSGKKCTAECVGHHVFKGTQLKKMTLTCTSHNFQPRRQFPDCVRNGKCRLTLSSHGKIKCRSHLNTIECQIYCGSRNKGPFTCKTDGSWTPSLPRCVKQLGDPEFIQSLPKGYQTWDQKQWTTR